MALFCGGIGGGVLGLTAFFGIKDRNWKLVLGGVSYSVLAAVAAYGCGYGAYKGTQRYTEKCIETAYLEMYENEINTAIDRVMNGTTRQPPKLIRLPDEAIYQKYSVEARENVKV